MKKPAIHVTLNDLAFILKSLSVDNSHRIAAEVFRQANEMNMQIRNRTLVIAETKKAMKVVSKTSTDTADASFEFKSILSLYRRTLRHKMIQEIGVNDKLYSTLKEVAEIAVQFCEAFGYKDRQGGYLRFCEIGISLMGKKYALNKFKYFAEDIFEVQTNALAIKSDVSPEHTQTVYEVWKECLQKYAGLERTLDRKHPQWIHIYHTKEQALLHGANLRDWVEAQFEGLAFMNVVPELSQLYTDRAEARYYSYMANKKKKHTAKPTQETGEELLDADAEMEAYWKKLENL
jgi:hypothetical protein